MATVQPSVRRLTAEQRREQLFSVALELFARQVMPEFQDRAEATDEIKERRLAPAVEAALARREPVRRVPAEYAFPATPAF